MSDLKVYWGGAWAKPTNVKVYWNGAWKVPTSVKVYWNGAWVTVWTGYVAVTGSATGAQVSYNNGTGRTPTTRSMSGTAHASASGGSGSYSYAWSVTGYSGLSSAPTISPSGSACTVSCSAAINQPAAVSLRCVISDGQTSVTVTTTCNFNYYNTL